MRKLRLLLALFVASIGALQTATARVAPTLPEAQTLVSGQSYYLYNVMEGKFLCRSTTSTSNAAIGTYGDKVTITSTGTEGEYYIRWASNKYYLYAYDSYVTSYSFADNTAKLTIAESSKGYTIQRSPSNTTYYKSDEFIGYDGSNGDRLTPALAEGSIHWQLISVDDAEYYFAKHKLFTYLEQADQYNFYVTQYEQVYDNPSSTTAELDNAQTTLENALALSGNYVSPSWTEYPILFQNNTDNKWELGTYDKSMLFWDFYGNNGEIKTSTLTATVNVDNNATLVFTYNTNSGYTNLRFFLDGELVQAVSNNQSWGKERRYYVELTPGKHDITWTCVGNDPGSFYSNGCYLGGIGIVNTPTLFPAATTVEGQLGTEMLKVTDPISKTRKVVINGVIGDDDWTTIGLMVNAFSIDMSGATATAPMPANMFTGSKFPFLHDVKLPQGLTAIGESAFSGSDVENEMTFPETLTSIGEYAFYNSKLKGAYMQDGITSVGNYAFQNCYYLENATWPATASTIPDNCFCNAYNLRTFTIPEGVTEIGQNAFCNCEQFNPRFPSTMEHINSFAFYNTATDELVITEDMTVNHRAFDNCSNLVYAEWPTSFATAERYYYTDGTNGVVTNCPKLNTVKLKSPTMVKYDSQNFFEGNSLSNITLQVPDYLVSAYKLDPYWYQCNVVGFNSADQSDWILKQPLTLNEGQRIGGTPNIDMQQQSMLIVNGEAVQTLGDLYFCKDWYDIGNWNTMILSNTNSVNINGKLTYRAYTPEKVWVFFCLPFDTKVGDINSGASYAIRYYDGASRANNGTGGNWKNYSADDIIPAGTGFILQTSKQCSTWFTAQDNASKQYVVSNNEFVKALEANPSDVNANKGWNLVGNPWPTYYNIHKLNFTAPITVWNGDSWSGGNYEAYSIIDDDYAIKPLEAIFVQCPDELNEISFPIDGRQLTTEIESQSGVRAQAATAKARRLIDVVLSDGDELSDKTRVVINEQAQQGYELSCDASKFPAMSSDVPQLYTIGSDDTRYAINERPTGEGVVTLGFFAPKSGSYTFEANRNDFKSITLVDNETGLSTDLSQQSYTFTTEAGTNNSRFYLLINGNGGVVTGVEPVAAAQQQGGQVYNLQGQRVSGEKKGLYIVGGKKVVK
ncbi:MAG: leucine-rich repeat protein [Prevotella sp.]|nr:leucine-rich repeat protein [Prevotella sp.]